MNDLPPDVRHVATVLRRDAALSPEQRARLLALALAAARTTLPEAPRPTPRPVTSPWLAFVGLSTALLVAATAWWGSRPPVAPPAARVPAEGIPPPPPAAPSPPVEHPARDVSRDAPATVREASVLPSSRPIARAFPVAHRVPTRPSPPPAPRSTPSLPESTVSPPAEPPRLASLEDELRVVRMARSANDRGAPSEALTALSVAPPLRLVWPEGAAERVVALCALGRREEALQLATDVLRRTPAGASAARIRRSCAGARPQ